jgi:hypothetical protein
MLGSQLSESKMRKMSMPCAAASFDELAHDVVGVGRVADGVGGAQQHLEADVGDRLAQLAQALPGVLVEEAHGDVEGGAAPHLEAVEVGSRCATKLAMRQHVVGAHARGHQRLVRVAQGRVGEQQALLLARSTRRTSRAQLVEQLAGACRRRRSGGFVAAGTGAAQPSAGGRAPATSGLPLTMTSPR